MFKFIEYLFVIKYEKRVQQGSPLSPLLFNFNLFINDIFAVKMQSPMMTL